MFIAESITERILKISWDLLSYDMAIEWLIAI